MRSWFAALALVLAGGTPAQARLVDERSFCDTLRWLLVAARERPAFGAIGPRNLGRAARGLGFEACRIDPGLYGSRLVCRRRSSPAYPTGPRLELRVANCLPEALRMSEPDGSPLARFRLGTLALHIDSGSVDTFLMLFSLPVERR